MNNAAAVAQNLVRITGVLQIVLGLVLWTGNALGLTSLHILLGLVLVLSLWALALMVGFSGEGGGLAGFALLWGAMVVALGLTQNRLLGANHWLIQLLHLVVGLVAIRLGESLGNSMRKRLNPVR